ncbi:hypothetical protein COOONC_22813 [Cooperia oncophora]
MCSLNYSSRITDCFMYSVPPGIPIVSAKFTMRRRRRRRSPMLSAALYELWRGGTKGLLGRGTIDGEDMDEITDIRVEVIRNAAHWFNGEAISDAAVDRWVKVEVLSNGHPSSYFDFFDEAPELDLVYHEGPPKTKCDPSVECCLVQHYVNFTEIG